MVEVGLPASGQDEVVPDHLPVGVGPVMGQSVEGVDGPACSQVLEEPAAELASVVLRRSESQRWPEPTLPGRHVEPGEDVWVVLQQCRHQLHAEPIRLDEP
jgi:hypothetical protein